MRAGGRPTGNEGLLMARTICVVVALGLALLSPIVLAITSPPRSSASSGKGPSSYQVATAQDRQSSRRGELEASSAIELPEAAHATRSLEP
jgi:hypothetical protein